MARTHRARAHTALAFESVYGAVPATVFRAVPFASTALGSEQPLIASELLGQGRNPLTPIKDAVTADGDVVVPIDVEELSLCPTSAHGFRVCWPMGKRFSLRQRGRRFSRLARWRHGRPAGGDKAWRAPHSTVWPRPPR